ncbi:MAG: HK97 family phage prohead protease, partial [Clostridia bacterium]|nr:HK97 family phage prohead protease [Clostridia bacterium]
EMKATLPDTEGAREVYESVKRGDLTGMSFAFTVEPGGDEYDPKTNTRTITKIAKVYECSVVMFPAYPQTSVEARNAQTESVRQYKAKQSLKILCNQILMKSEV